MDKFCHKHGPFFSIGIKCPKCEKNKLNFELAKKGELLHCGCKVGERVYIPRHNIYGILEYELNIGFSVFVKNKGRYYSFDIQKVYP